MQKTICVCYVCQTCYPTNTQSPLNSHVTAKSYHAQNCAFAYGMSFLLPYRACSGGDVSLAITTDLNMSRLTHEISIVMQVQVTFKTMPVSRV